MATEPQIHPDIEVLSSPFNDIYILPRAARRSDIFKARILWQIPAISAIIFACSLAFELAYHDSRIAGAWPFVLALTSGYTFVHFGYRSILAYIISHTPPRVTVETNAERIRVLVKFPLIGYRIDLKLSDLKTLIVTEYATFERTGSNSALIMQPIDTDNRYTLCFQSWSNPQFLIAEVYPRDVVESLARIIAHKCSYNPTIEYKTRRDVEIRIGTVDSPCLVQHVSDIMPAQSLAAVSREKGSFSVLFPEIKRYRTFISRVMIHIALLLGLCIASAASVALFLAWMHREENTIFSSLHLALSFILISGVALAIAAVQKECRITVTVDNLQIEQFRKLLPPKTYCWKWTEIRAIQCINPRADKIDSLSISLKNKRWSTKFLIGYPSSEILWITTALASVHGNSICAQCGRNLHAPMHHKSCPDCGWPVAPIVQGMLDNQ